MKINTEFTGWRASGRMQHAMLTQGFTLHGIVTLAMVITSERGEETRREDVVYKVFVSAAKGAE